MMLALTPLQRCVAGFIQEFSDARGYAPSMREIAAELGMTTSGAHKVCDALTSRGWLVRLRGKARSMVLLGRLDIPDLPDFVGLFDDPDLAAKAKASGLRRQIEQALA